MPLVVHLIDFSERNSWIEEQLPLLRDLGLNQGLISISKEGSIHQTLRSRNLTRIHAVSPNIRGIFRVITLLKSWSREEKVYIYAHGHLPSVYASLFKLTTGTSFVICHHHTTEFFMQLKKRMHFKAMFHLVLSQLYYRSAIKIQSLSPEVTHSLLVQGIRADKIIEIPFGIPFDKYYKMEKVLSKTINQETKHVVSIGRLVWNKRIDLGLKSVESLIKSGVKVDYSIVGEGPELAELKNLAKQLGIERHVFFLGQREDINDILNTADFFFHLSLTESYSQVIMEARLAELPIFTSPCGVALEMEILKDPLLHIFRTSDPKDIAIEFRAFINLMNAPSVIDPRRLYQNHEYEDVLKEVAKMFLSFSVA
jgi:glycosyltransferase involved in cell wall biosynthesis